MYYFTDDSGRIFDHPVKGTDNNRLSLSQAEETRDGIVDFSDSSAADSTTISENKALFWILSLAISITISGAICFGTDGCDGEPILVLGTLIGAIAGTVYCGSFVYEYNLKSALFAGGASILGMIAAVILIIIVCAVIAVVMAFSMITLSIVLVFWLCSS